MTNEQRINIYVTYAVGIANDDAHGYSQINRDGNPDFDCSSLVASALKQAGFGLFTKDTCTGNMFERLIKSGFTTVTRPYKRGDIFLSHNNNKQHTAIYIGDNKIVHARSSYGNTKAGDQNGNEIAVTDSLVFAPDYVFRLSDCEANNMKYDNVLLPVLRRGDKHFCVGVLQTLLNYHCGYVLEVDNDFGKLTEQAVLEFQKKKFTAPKEHDGVVGVRTWGKLLNNL